MNKFSAQGLSILVALMASTSLKAEDGYKTVMVELQNLSPNQIMTPPIVFSHKASFKLFTKGEALRSSMIPLVEDGVNARAAADLTSGENQKYVTDLHAASGPILPGDKMLVEIRAKKGDMITFASMLATTNDAFVAATTPMGKNRTTQRLALVYDAGTEANNESCDSIPGPPCGNPGVRTQESEGFVHLFRGVHGGSDLSANELDPPTISARIRARVKR